MLNTANSCAIQADGEDPYTSSILTGAYWWKDIDRAAQGSNKCTDLLQFVRAISITVNSQPIRKQSMVGRVVKLREAGDAGPEIDEHLSQRKRPENGRYWLQVDRQTKASYAAAETAEAAGRAIKAGHPLVQVGVYDSVECLYTLVELPAALQ